MRPLRASGAFASAFNVCSDEKELPPPAASQGSIPIPATELLLSAGMHRQCQCLALGLSDSLTQTFSSSYIHTGLESAHKQSWIQLPRKEVAWDIRDLPLAVAGSRQRVKTLQRNPVEHQLPPALSILRMTYHRPSASLGLHFLSRCSAQQTLCQSLPLDVPPQRKPDFKVHPSPANQECSSGCTLTGCNACKKSPQDVQSTDVERRWYLGKGEH